MHENTCTLLLIFMRPYHSYGNCRVGNYVQKVYCELEVKRETAFRENYFSGTLYADL